jgi:hypothetical protein
LWIAKPKLKKTINLQKKDQIWGSFFDLNSLLLLLLVYQELNKSVAAHLWTRKLWATSWRCKSTTTSFFAFCILYVSTTTTHLASSPEKKLKTSRVMRERRVNSSCFACDKEWQALLVKVVDFRRSLFELV